MRCVLYDLFLSLLVSAEDARIGGAAKEAGISAVVSLFRCALSSLETAASGLSRTVSESSWLDSSTAVRIRAYCFSTTSVEEIRHHELLGALLSHLVLCHYIYYVKETIA
jgi:hypothetical protein